MISRNTDVIYRWLQSWTQRARDRRSTLFPHSAYLYIIWIDNTSEWASDRASTVYEMSFFGYPPEIAKSGPERLCGPISGINMWNFKIDGPVIREKIEKAENVNRRMDGWTDGRTDGWTDGRTNGHLDPFYKIISEKWPNNLFFFSTLGGHIQTWFAGADNGSNLTVHYVPFHKYHKYLLY